jgi:dolichyl-diphosphooligosaccharide--protein glycosyltransferase
VLANLFLIPVFLYGWRIGYPAAGLMGGLVATFSIGYYARSSIGWVDTDCLNLLLPCAASLLVLCIRREQRLATVLLLSAALGVTLYLYFLWYEHPAFAFLYWATLVLHLVLQRMRWQWIALSVATCVLFSHPLQAALGLSNIALLVSRYVLETNIVAPFSRAARWFPDVMQTVGEAQHGSLKDAFASILSQPTAAMIGVLSFAMLAIVRWRQCVPLLPLVAIAALALIRGTRFAMYLAPLAGIGLGILIEVALRGFMTPRRNDELDEHEADRRAVEQRAAKLVRSSENPRALLTYVAVLVVFFVGLKPMTGIGYVPPPALPAETVIALRELGRELPPGTPIWTWWDYGYAIVQLASLATYHDGGGQYTPQTNVIANSLVVADETVLRNTAFFVDRYGNKGIDDVAGQVDTREALLMRIGRSMASPESNRNIHVLFTSNLVPIFTTIVYAAGRPIKSERGELLKYESLHCSPTRSDGLRCTGLDIDLSNGMLSDGRAVRRLVIAIDGNVVTAREYRHESGLVVEMLQDLQGRTEILLLPDDVYRSNLNRMFLLGQYDRSLFEEVYRRYPFVRVYRIRH